MSWIMPSVMSHVMSHYMPYDASCHASNHISHNIPCHVLSFIASYHISYHISPHVLCHASCHVSFHATCHISFYASHHSSCFSRLFHAALSSWSLTHCTPTDHRHSCLKIKCLNSCTDFPGSKFSSEWCVPSTLHRLLNNFPYSSGILWVLCNHFPERFRFRIGSDQHGITIECGTNWELGKNLMIRVKGLTEKRLS